MLLKVSNLTVCYDKAMIINDISMHVSQGELVSLVGPNGAGKSTLLRAITGLVIWEKGIHRGTSEGDITLEGAVVFENHHLERVAAHEIARRGLIHCPERRRPFREMTVLENLYAGAYLTKDKRQQQDNLKNVYQLFPRLSERAKQISGTLSGGEQQMLAIGRALMSEPELLLVDELSLGLMPKIIDICYEVIAELNHGGLTIVLVEQSTQRALDVADQVCVLESSQTVWKGSALEARNSAAMIDSLLGLRNESGQTGSATLG